MSTVRLTTSRKFETLDKDLHLLSVLVDDDKPIVVIATSRAEAIYRMFDYLTTEFPDFIIEEVEV